MVMNRGCTDVLMLLIFIVFVGSMVGLSGYAFVKGDKQRLFYPVVSLGNSANGVLQICGVDGDLVGYNNLYISDLG